MTYTWSDLIKEYNMTYTWSDLVDEKRTWLIEYIAKTKAWNNDVDDWQSFTDEAAVIVDDFINKNLVCKDKEV